MVLSKNETGEKCDSLCSFCLLPDNSNNFIKGVMQKSAC